MAKTEACDVAKYILKKMAPDRFGDRITAWKLQKLVFYSQAWSLVWDDGPLFDDEIQAWANGPVCLSLYDQHRGRFRLYEGDIKGDARRLSKDARDTIDAVLNHYGGMTAQYLSELTHREQPWIKAREGLDRGERGQNEITWDAMAEYYGGL